MPWTSEHLKWIVNAGQIEINDGKSASVFEFKYKKDNTVLSAWAKHFRNYYCPDTEIDLLRQGTGKSRSQYLMEIKFPDKNKAPGPSIRAGDFGEILIADYVRYILKYWVPRTRYADKSVRNESKKGADIIGFKFIGKNESPQDTLIIFESKTKFTGHKPTNRLQDAVNDSTKDPTRKAESLNAIKQRLLDKGCREGANKIKRFQNITDKPYRELSGAAALFSNNLYDESLISKTSVNSHPNAANLILVLMKGNDIMDLVHELYRRAAVEAG